MPFRNLEKQFRNFDPKFRSPQNTPVLVRRKNIKNNVFRSNSSYILFLTENPLCQRACQNLIRENSHFVNNLTTVIVISSEVLEQS